MTLSELIEALENATDPDREIDAQIWLLLTEGATRSTSHIVSATNAWPPYDIDETRDSSGRLITVPPYSASFDAAMDLVKSRFPGWRVFFEAEDGIAADLFILGPLYRDDYPERESSPPIAGKPIAMALVLATLKALQARGDA